MNPQQKYILFLAQIVEVSVRVVTTDERYRKELEAKLVNLFFSSLLNSLKEDLDQKNIDEVIKNLRQDVSFDKNVIFLLGYLAENVDEQRLADILSFEFEKFAKTVLEMVHQTLAPEASKEFDSQLANLGQTFTAL